MGTGSRCSICCYLTQIVAHFTKDLDTTIGRFVSIYKPRRNKIPTKSVTLRIEPSIVKNFLDDVPKALV
jgi:hypothetical protein